MHYVRLLRSPKLLRSRRTQVSLVLAVTTDLGDSLLREPVDLVITALVNDSTYKLSGGGKLQWNPSDRVLKPLVELPPDVVAALASGGLLHLCVAAGPSADTLLDIWAGGRGLVMPVWVTIKGNEAQDDLCTRKLRLNGPQEPAEYLELEEELGESIARHIWDAAPVVLASIMAAVSGYPAYEPSAYPLTEALKHLLDKGDKVNILELGCGVGILGAGFSALTAGTILMTDLEQAERRARKNVSLVGRSRSGRLLYENLDWEDGRHGRFGPLLQRRRWDLVILSDCTYNTDTLPALVATLSAVHAHNAARAGDDEAFSATKVFLATKQRHGSEQLAWQLLAREGWKQLMAQTLPLPVLGGESQSIDMYLFEKV